MSDFREELIDLMLKHKELDVGYTNPHLVTGIIQALESAEEGEDFELMDLLWDWVDELREV